MKTFVGFRKGLNFVFAIMVGACSVDADGTSRRAYITERITDLATEQNIADCKCDVEFGLYVSMRECLETKGEPSRFPNSFNCWLDLITEYQAETQTLCHLDAIATYVACIGELSCEELQGAAMQSCQDARNIEFDSCDLLPPGLQQEIDARCYLACDTGEMLPIDFRCDGKGDCPDESDEYTCGG